MVRFLAVLMIVFACVLCIPQAQAHNGIRGQSFRFGNVSTFRHNGFAFNNGYNGFAFRHNNFAFVRPVYSAPFISPIYAPPAAFVAPIVAPSCYSAPVVAPVSYGYSAPLGYSAPIVCGGCQSFFAGY